MKTRNGHSRSVAGSAVPATIWIWEGTDHGDFETLRFVKPVSSALFRMRKKKLTLFRWHWETSGGFCNLFTPIFRGIWHFSKTMSNSMHIHLLPLYLQTKTDFETWQEWKSQTCEKNTSLINFFHFLRSIILRPILRSFRYLTIVQACSCCLLVGNRETKLVLALFLLCRKTRLMNYKC